MVEWCQVIYSVMVRIPQVSSCLLPPPCRMNAPPPLEFGLQSSSPSSTSTASSSQPDTVFTTAEEPRASSETTIFSIYSMYGEDHASNTSWSGSCNRGLKDCPMLPPVNLSHSPNERGSFLSAHDSSMSGLGLVYSLPQKQQQVVDLTDIDCLSSSSGRFSPPMAPCISLRPYSPPPALQPPPSESLESSDVPAHVPVSENPSPGGLRAHPPGLSQSSLCSRSISPKSRPSSQTSSLHPQFSAVSISRELPPSAPATPPSTPPPNSVQQLTPSVLLSPQNSTRLSIGRLQSNSSSPSSKLSLVPSEGEDFDSFHVRSTYAILEVSGVKGDGYEEGVERTRARLGSNRHSQLTAEISAREKTKSLNPKEFELLAAVDR